jgi:hypothetical protein
MENNDNKLNKYKCVKVPFSSILHKTDYENLRILEDAITRTNTITTQAYLLLRLWILNKYHNHIEIPVITTDTIMTCVTSLFVKTNNTNGDKSLLNEFNNLQSTSFYLESGKCLSNVLKYYATTMITSIENNIKMHFFDYINRFIFSYYKNLHKEELDGKKGKEFRKVLYKELNVVKKDIIENTLVCDPKYHAWISENRYKIVPETFDTSYYYDIKIEPYRYLKHMIFMCLELEKIECKSFQFFPIQSSAIPKNIQIDTRTLIELFVDSDRHKELIDVCIKTPRKNKDGKDMKKTKSELLVHIEDNKEFLWDGIFNITQTKKNYVFNHTIITDGYSCSLRFIHKDFVEEQQHKTKMKQNGKFALKDLTKEEKDKIKKDKKEEQKEKAKQTRMENKDKPKQSKKDKKSQSRIQIHRRSSKGKLTRKLYFYRSRKT